MDVDVGSIPAGREGAEDSDSACGGTVVDCVVIGSGAEWIVGPRGEILGAADEDAAGEVGRRRVLMRNAVLRLIVISES